MANPDVPDDGVRDPVAAAVVAEMKHALCLDGGSGKRSNTWGHWVRALSAADVDDRDRFGVHCSSRCPNVVTHVRGWWYHPGRGGTGTPTTSKAEVCQTHAERFAARRRLSIGAPVEEPPRPGIIKQVVTSMHADPHRMWVERLTRPGMNGALWDVSFGGAGMLVANHDYLDQVPAGGQLAEALRAAEALAAHRFRLVPAGEWVTEHERRGVVTLAYAEDTPAWAEVPWVVEVHTAPANSWCDHSTDWRLTLRLDERFPTVGHGLGWHNMTLDRAVSTADMILGRDGWTLVDGWYRTDTMAVGVATHERRKG